MQNSGAAKSVPSLYEWIGGNEKLEGLMETFYKKVSGDPVIGPLFTNMSPDHVKHVAHFIGEVFGGPEKYTGEDGGSHHKMIGHHIGKHLTEQQRKRWLALLLDTADEQNIPVDPEFRSALMAYLEWGTRLAVVNSQTSENPIEKDTPMPKWGWGEPGGPYQPKNILP